MEKSASKEERRINLQISDLKAKLAVLKIYYSACYWIEKTLSLKYWFKREIRVKSIKLDKKPGPETLGRTNLLTGHIKILRFPNDDRHPILQQSLPHYTMSKFTEFVYYDNIQPCMT